MDWPTARTDLVAEENQWTCDFDRVRRKLAADARRLFSAEADEVDVWRVVFDAQVHRKRIALSPKIGLGSLEQLWENPADDNIIYIMRQTNTWDRLRVKLGTFRAICSHHQVFPYFMETVHCFGNRLLKCPTPSDSSRGRRAVKETLGPFDRLVFIISFVPKQNIREIHRSARLALAHVSLLFSSMANWGEYIDAQTTILRETEEKVAFVHVEHRAADDYSVRFTDRQTVQLLRRKLLKAASILQASTDIGCMIKARFEKSNLFTADLLNVLITELDDYIAEATYYRRCVDDLLQRSWDTNNLLTNILEYRVGSSTLETSKTSDSALQKMKEIAVQGEWDNELNQKTSITTKALTVVATIYLPASLLSVRSERWLFNIEMADTS
ncbi:hypothetical protein CLAIMM_13155 isoform 1 [Cladophialophora immunda]|nr:hypothetical protein CLAIMM_13155 isoform 1 [Cladophialophora immunda]